LGNFLDFRNFRIVTYRVKPSKPKRTQIWKKKI
jgi:hypothetical protein